MIGQQMMRANEPLLKDLLGQVSRSFYLTLRILPAAVRPQIGLAYLLARATDTIADTTIVPVARRLAALRMLRDRILGAGNRPLDFSDLAGGQGTPAERALLERVEEAVAVLNGIEPPDQRWIREVLAIISGGQELDLTRFAGATADRIIPLRTDAELDDYTYRVAGCVGEFWTRICRAHLFPNAPLDEVQLLSDGRRFGKGLQLVNILRDIPADLRQGRCYIPAEALARCGLEPEELRLAETEPRFRPLYRTYLALARDQLAAGWRYTNALPRSCTRVRLGCAWPILLGLATLNALAARNVLAPGQPIKISRRDVRRILFRTIIRYPFPRRWELLFAETAAPLQALPAPAIGS